MKPTPQPAHVIPIGFHQYGKDYRLYVYLFNTDDDLNTYYSRVSKPSMVDKRGVYASAIFDVPTKENKYLIGSIIFSLENLHPSIIAHEAVHMIFNYYEHSHGLDFTKRRREETFCDILECIIDNVYKYIINNNISYTMLPKYRAV